MFKNKKGLSLGVPETQFNFLSAIEAHVRWKIRLEAYIAGTSTEELDPEIVSQDDQCALGKWIHSAGREKYGEHPRFVDLVRIHADFHRCAGEVVRHVDNGETEAARKLLQEGEYARQSHRIKSELARLSLELEP